MAFWEDSTPGTQNKASPSLRKPPLLRPGSSFLSQTHIPGVWSHVPKHRCAPGGHLSLCPHHLWLPGFAARGSRTLRGEKRNLQGLPLGAQPHLEVQVVCPLPDDFVLRGGVPDLVLVDVVTPWSISVLIERHRSPSNACGKGGAQHPQHPQHPHPADGVQGGSGWMLPPRCFF